MMPIDTPRDPSGSPPACGHRWALLYDADCGFCRWSLQRVLSWDRDGALRPVALGTAEADKLLSDMAPEQRAASWHLVAPDGRRWSAGAAAAPLLRRLPGGRVPARLLAASPRATDRVYRWVADHRSQLGRLVSR
jgi:predicted DCC family thiol-disulfide oxidoreductase YuxK